MMSRYSLDLLIDNMIVLPSQNITDRVGYVVHISGVTNTIDTEFKIESATRTRVVNVKLDFNHMLGRKVGSRIYNSEEIGRLMKWYGVHTPNQLIGEVAIALHTEEEYEKSEEIRRIQGAMPYEPRIVGLVPIRRKER